jgi:pSer/pThr/pTyr-binding forkhead associated (FHA) protein
MEMMLGMSSEVKLEVQSLGKTEYYELVEPVYRIGRDEDCDIVISDRTCSPFHVCLLKQGEQYFVIHCDYSPKRPTNGVYVNGKALPLVRDYKDRVGEMVGQARPLYHRDRIRLSPSIMLRYRQAEE